MITEFLHARAYLYRQLYIHKSTRGYEALLRSILAYAASLEKRGRSGFPPGTPVAVRKVLAGTPVTTEEYLALDDFRMWTVLADWAAAARDQQLKNMCARLINRGRPYQPIRLDREATQHATRMIERLTHERSGVRFHCHLDTFSDLAYRDVFGRSAKEDEELQYQSILLVDDSGRVRFAGSNEWIKKTGELEVEAFRLYYDDQDRETVKRLRAQNLLS